MKGQNRNIYDEYRFLNKKIKKLQVRWKQAKRLKKDRLKRYMKRFIKRRLEIIEFLDSKGLPRPEKLENKKQINYEVQKELVPKTPHLLNPINGELSPSMKRKFEEIKLQKNYVTTVS